MNKKGQALVEYVLIIAIMSVIAITLVNEEYEKGDKPGEGKCVSPDSEDIMDTE